MKSYISFLVIDRLGGDSVLGVTITDYTIVVVTAVITLLFLLLIFVWVYNRFIK